MNFERWRHYARGWLFHFFGRNDEAFGEYSLAFRHDPNHLQSALHLAHIAVQQERPDAAEHWMLEAARIAPDNADNFFNLGFVRNEMGKPAAAIEAFREAVRLKPSLDRAWYGMGMALGALGDHVAAIAPLDEAARLQPMNGHAFYQLGMACHLAGKGDRLARIVSRLAEFEPKMARQLVRDSGRDDLAALLPDLPEWATR